MKGSGTESFLHTHLGRFESELVGDDFSSMARTEKNKKQLALQ